MNGLAFKWKTIKVCYLVVHRHTHTHTHTQRHTLTHTHAHTKKTKKHAHTNTQTHIHIIKQVSLNKSCSLQQIILQNITTIYNDNENRMYLQK